MEFWSTPNKDSIDITGRRLLMLLTNRDTGHKDSNTKQGPMEFLCRGLRRDK